MITTKRRCDFEICEPLVVGERRIFIVSRINTITIPKFDSVAGVIVNPLSAIVLEKDTCYGFSFAKAQRLDIEELIRDYPSLEEEFFKMSGISLDSLKILNSEKEEKHERYDELEDVRKQIMTVGNELHEYLEDIQAEVENYKLSVENYGEGIEVEIQLKVFVHPKSRDAVKIIPK